MRLSALLKILADLRKKTENGTKSRATDWIKDFFIATGADYLTKDENEKKASTLLKHVFSPALGRSTLPPELTDVILDNKTLRYWLAFKYLLDNIEWETNINKINGIVADIVNDENLYLKSRDFGLWNNPFSCSYKQCFKKIDINLIISQKLGNESQKRFVLDFLLGYFYHLVQWDVVIATRFGMRFEYEKYHPNISCMLNIHNYDVDFIDEHIISKNITGITISQFGYADLVYNTGTHKIKRLFFPRKELVTKSFYYNTEDLKLYSEIEHRYYSADNRYYSISNDCTWFSYIDRDYILLWNLMDVNNGAYHYKILKAHGINTNVNNLKSISFNESNDKIIIKTRNAGYNISVKDFDLVETKYKLGDNDNLIDERRQVYINNNILYTLNFEADHPMLIDFNLFGEKDVPFIVDVDLGSPQMEISEDFNFYVVQCIDKTIWVLDKNKTKKIKIVDQPILDETNRNLSKLDPNLAGIKTVLKMLISESQKYALIFWSDNKEYYISIVELEEMKSCVQSLIFNNAITIMTDDIGTNKDEFIIPFKVKENNNKIYKKAYHLSLRKNEIIKNTSVYRL